MTDQQNTSSLAERPPDADRNAISEHSMAVLEAIVTGKTLQEAGVDSAFLLEVAKHPTLGLGFAKAREMSSYALEEEAIGRLRAAVAEGKVTSTQLRAIDLLVQQLRWSSIKRNPNVYSEKAAVNITVPIEIKTTLDLGDGATAGTKEFPNIYEAVAEVPTTVPLEQAAEHLPGGDAVSAIRYGGAILEAPGPDAGDTEAGQETLERPPRPGTVEGQSDPRRETGPEPANTGQAPRRSRKPRQVQRLHAGVHEGVDGQAEGAA